MPALVTDSSKGTSWSSGKSAGSYIPLDLFYIAHDAKDNAASINAALIQGKNVLFTPGNYHLESSIQVARPQTIVLGIGFPSLIPDKGTPAIVVSDVDGVKIGGILFEAGTVNSKTLLQIGDSGTVKTHSTDPICLYDIFCRAGGAFNGLATTFVTVGSNNVLYDHTWLWRADDGAATPGWDANKNLHALIVNGNNMTVYGLMAEHTEEYQTVWNGNGGRMYMYQSELPYDPPDQASWQHNGINGYASYKVADAVTSHEAWGIGVYCVFTNAVSCFNAVEAPTGPGIKMHHMLTLRLGGAAGSEITHVINGTGAAATSASRVQRVN